MDAGFFERNGYLFPKVISVDMSFKTYEDYISGYNFTNQDANDPQWKLDTKVSNSAHGFRDSHLFPYNRKTVKI